MSNCSNTTNSSDTYTPSLKITVLVVSLPPLIYTVVYLWVYVKVKQYREEPGTVIFISTVLY